MDIIWTAAGAAAWGAAELGGLQSFLDQGAKDKIDSLCPGAATVLVAAFPYYAGDTPGNLSLYCRGEDYHQVVTRRLETVCQELGSGILPVPSCRGRTTPPSRSWQRLSWPGWATRAATACGSCLPTAPMCSWGPS